MEPRLWTPPTRELTPDTSYGYDLIDFASDVLEVDLDPWQQWAAIHMGELLVDGRPRFRTVLILVSRQNGKTLLAKCLVLYWMVIELVPLVLGTSTNREYAKATWTDVIDMAQGNDWIGPMVSSVRKMQNSEHLMIGASKYVVAANNRRAGRSLTVHRLLMDELREQQDWDTWNAAVGAMAAVADGQVVAVCNQGDDTSVVLNSLHRSAVEFIETGEGDPRLGLFEWSAPPGSDPTDPDALAAANPDLGNRIQLDTLLGQAARAKRAGGEELAGFRTEHMCQRVVLLDAAIDEAAWSACTGEITDLTQIRSQVALGLDVAMDGSHATLVAAAQHAGRVHIDIVKEWDGFGAISEVKRDLARLTKRVQPGIIGWFPNGPAAGLAAELRSGWAPRGTEVMEIKADMPAVCMGLAEQVTDRQVVHGADPMLTRHITSAQRLHRGDAWVFTRKGAEPVDGAYATAAAVHLARTMPPPRPPLRVAT